MESSKGAKWMILALLASTLVVNGDDAGQTTYQFGSYNYNLDELKSFQPFHVELQQPKGSKLIFSLYEGVDCGDVRSSGCIHVPGLAPESTGNWKKAEPLHPERPAAGLLVKFDGGSVCQTQTGKTRSTEIHLHCPSDLTTRTHTLDESETVKSLSGYEKPQPSICEYVVNIITPTACPISLQTTVTSISGCVSSSLLPAATLNCSSTGGYTLMLHGVGFTSLHRRLHDVHFGDDVSCKSTSIVSDWLIECPIRIVHSKRLSSTSSYKPVIDYEKNGNDWEITLSQGVFITFKSAPDFQYLFHNLHDYCIGGMFNQINEIYERIFMSRAVQVDVLEELGLTHVKGLILYGDPGTGKSLLSKTIASIMSPQHVRVVSAPEILNKNVGESEGTLRQIFTPSLRDWNEFKHQSPLHVIIIDEIDAISKPRGKDTTNVGSLVYDSIVNQLLTLLDGTRSQDNLLVIGLTNRFELLDPALLRPGRFEVHIEMTTPTSDEREDILKLLLRKSSNNHRLNNDVDIKRLARLTVDYTPADLAGLVRKAQMSALHREMSSGDMAQITMSDLVKSLSSKRSIWFDEWLRSDNCTHIDALYKAINDTGSKIPAGKSLNIAALVLTDDYASITPCMVRLFTDHHYHVTVYDSEDYLENPHLFSTLHRTPSKVTSSRVAIIMNDLCFTLTDCSKTTDSAGTDNSKHFTSDYNKFLLSFRNLLKVQRDKRIVVVATCPSTCWSGQLAKHFHMQFKMTSIDL